MNVHANKRVGPLNIDHNEVLRYLRYKSSDIDKYTMDMITECIKEVKSISSGNYIYKLFDIDIEYNIYLYECDTEIVSENLKQHLSNCDKCAIIGATLGIDIDNKIRYYSKTNLTKAIIFDACATTAIESLADFVSSSIEDMVSKKNYKTTSRFSPGYGDLSLDYQSKILRVIEGNTIGLTCNDNNILIPRKSITAFIGIGKKILKKSTSCNNCNLSKDCMYTKDGDIYECTKKVR
ncbi:methionine synthase [Clostridiaceae bacterium M8S5]|nr:methionine synthase [Clostridiaceae bacterium M8S5]